jgi:hypothetical protein
MKRRRKTEGVKFAELWASALSPKALDKAILDAIAGLDDPDGLLKNIIEAGRRSRQFLVMVRAISMGAAMAKLPSRAFPRPIDQASAIALAQGIHIGLAVASNRETPVQ